MRLVFTIAALALLAACDTAPAPTGATAAAPAATVAPAAAASTSSMSSLLNATRAANGRGALSENAQLDRAAAGQARYLAASSTALSTPHLGPGGNQIGDRVRNTGYCWGHVAENFAYWPNATPDYVVNQVWMNSPGHKANILSNDNTEFGFAQSGSVFILVFARPC